MKNQPKDITGIVVIVMIILVCGFFGFVIFSNPTQSGNPNNTPGNASIDTSGKQIVEMTASLSGYTPGVVQATGGKATILRVTSNNDFGCSSSFRIPQLGIAKNLPPTGTTDIDLGTQASGTIINATCSMGMYRMQIKFS